MAIDIRDHNGRVVVSIDSDSLRGANLSGARRARVLAKTCCQYAPAFIVGDQRPGGMGTRWRRRAIVLETRRCCPCEEEEVGRELIDPATPTCDGLFLKGSAMLSELEKRKPDLAELDSVRVTFADGQPWLIPKPFLEVRPHFEQGVAKTAYMKLAYGRGVDDYIAALAELGDVDAMGATLVATIAAAL